MTLGNFKSGFTIGVVVGFLAFSGFSCEKQPPKPTDSPSVSNDENEPLLKSNDVFDSTNNSDITFLLEAADRRFDRWQKDKDKKVFQYSYSFKVKRDSVTVEYTWGLDKTWSHTFSNDEVSKILGKQ